MSTIQFIETPTYVEISYFGLNAELLAAVDARLTALEAEFESATGGITGQLGSLQDDINDLNSITAAQSSALDQEIEDRTLADSTNYEHFSNEIIDVIDDYSDAILNEANTRAQAILDEATARGVAIASSQAAIIADNAILATSVSGMAVELASATASIIEVQDALVTETEARAAQYDVIQVAYDDNTAAVLEESVARADADTAIAFDVTVVEAAVALKINTFRQTSAPTATAVGDVWYDSDDGDKPYRWNGSSWVAVQDGAIAVNAAAVVTEASARASADSALGSLITAVTATANGAAAAVVTEQSARIAADGSISGKYSVKVDVNGNVSGFDLISTANVNGTPLSTFNFTSTSFNIYNGTSAVAPFSVSGGIVRMANVIIGNAVIENLAVGTSKIANSAVTKVVADTDGTATPTSLTSATWTTISSVNLGGTDWNDQSGTPGGQYKRIVTISVDVTAIDSGTFANAFVSAKIRTGDGSGSWNDIWEGMSDGGVTTIKNYGQIKGSFTIVHDVDDGFVGLPNTRIYQLQLYATGATSRGYKICSIVVQSVKK